MKNFLIALITLFSFTLNAQSNFHFGGGIAFNTKPNKIGAQMKVTKVVGENVDLEFATTFFPTDMDKYTLDANAYYVATDYNEFFLKPYIGINYVSFDKEVIVNPNDNNSTDIGVNFGIEVTKPNIDGISPFVNAKYVYAGLDSYVLSVGVFF